MAAFARTPVLPEVAPVRAPWACRYRVGARAGGNRHWQELLTNERPAPSSTSQFDPVIDNLGRLRGRQRQPCKHRDIARGLGVFQGNLYRAFRKAYGYVSGQPQNTGLFG